MPERCDFRQELLVDRLRAAVAALNSTIPAAAREDAIEQIVDLRMPILLATNRLFHVPQNAARSARHRWYCD